MLRKLRETTIAMLIAVSSAAAQNAPNPGAAGTEKPVAARLVCPPADQAVAQDPATFTWSGGSQTPNYRLLLGPARGSSDNGDSSLITGDKGQLAGLPAGKNLVVTLWSYDRDGNAVQPPSYCVIKTAPQAPLVSFKDVAGTSFTGVSLGSFPPAGGEAAGQGCQAQCKLNAACQGYTFYPAGNGNPAAMCDLKSQITESQPNECCRSALKTVTTPALPAPAPAPASRTPSPAAAPAVSQARPSAPPARSSDTAKLITGDWVNQFGGVSKIVQKGNAITGTYSDAKQTALSGTIKGTFDGSTLRATLNWKDKEDNSHGSLELTLTPLGRLEGTWTDADGVTGPWNMGRAGEKGN